jgi:hypothetical protein
MELDHCCNRAAMVMAMQTALLAPPLPMLLLADIFHGRREAAWKHCRLAAMLTSTTTVQMMTGGSE